MAWYDAESGAAIAKGDVVCVSPVAGALRVRKADSASLAAAGLPIGIALAAVAGGRPVPVAESGAVGSDVTGLAPADGQPPAPVGVKDGRCVRLSASDPPGLRMGTVDARGVLTLGLRLGSSDPTASDVTALREKLEALTGALAELTSMVSPLLQATTSLSGAVDDLRARLETPGTVPQPTVPTPAPAPPAPWKAVHLLGKVGDAYSRIDFAKAPEHNLTGDMTIELWMRPDRFYSTQPFFGTDHDAEGMLHFDTSGSAVYAEAGLEVKTSLLFRWGDGKTRANLSVPLTLRVGEWIHLAVVRQLSGTPECRVYVDGKKVFEGAATNGATSGVASPYKWSLGGSYSQFVGAVTELRLWKVARADAEVAAAWNSRIPADAPGLVSCFRLDEKEPIATLADVCGRSTGTALNVRSAERPVTT